MKSINLKCIPFLEKYSTQLNSNTNLILNTNFDFDDFLKDDKAENAASNLLRDCNTELLSVEIQWQQPETGYR